MIWNISADVNQSIWLVQCIYWGYILSPPNCFCIFPRNQMSAMWVSILGLHIGTLVVCISWYQRRFAMIGVTMISHGSWEGWSSSFVPLSILSRLLWVFSIIQKCKNQNINLYKNDADSLIRDCVFWSLLFSSVYCCFFFCKARGPSQALAHARQTLC